MTKEIATGIDQIVKHMDVRQEEQSQLQWRDLRNKIDSILLSTNVLKSDEARRRCLIIDNMTPYEREEYITQNWGPNYLQKISPLLYQLEILENHIDKVELNDGLVQKENEDTPRPASESDDE